ncbi:hypothetical protein HYT04_00105 [Candidatus Kaiserbacteria bacterium]|nr:hypothetical protein [Candidatus Kaiserbacteria bacterium]
MTTKIVIITHPDCDDSHPVRLTNNERSAFLKILKSLEKFVKDKKVAVLASAAPEITFYANSVARHFGSDEPEICECLLRNGRDELDVNDGCDCICDFISPEFDLVIAIAENGFAGMLANSLSSQVKRPCNKIHKLGMSDVYVI